MSYQVSNNEIVISYKGASYVVTLTADPASFRIKSPTDGSLETVDPATAANLFGAEQAVTSLSLYYGTSIIHTTVADWATQLANNAQMIGVNTFSNIAASVPGVVTAGFLTDGVGVLPTAAAALYGAVIGVPVSEADLTLTTILLRDALNVLKLASTKNTTIQQSISANRNTPLLYDDIKSAIDLTQIGLFLGKSASQIAGTIPLVANKPILDVSVGFEVNSAKGIADSVSDVDGLFSLAHAKILGALSTVSTLIDAAGELADQIKFESSIIALGSALNSDTARYAPLTQAGLIQSASALQNQPATTPASHASLYSIGPNPASFNENSGTVTFTITRADTSQAATVYVSTVQDQGVDNPNNHYYYNGLLNQPITFLPTVATAQIQLTINDLGLTSGAEAFRLIAQQNATDPFTTSLASTTFTIVNSDQPPASIYTLTPNAPNISENAGTVKFTISRTNTSQAITVYVSTVHDQGYANLNADYYYNGLLDFPVTFAAGAATAQAPLTINDLGLSSGNETFRLIVQQHPNDSVSTALASDTFMIVNNDPGIIANALINKSVNSTFQLQPFLSLPTPPTGLSISLVNFINTHTGPGQLTNGGTPTPGNVAVAYANVSQVGFLTGSATGSDEIEMYATYSDGTKSNTVDLTVNIVASAPPPPPPQNSSGPVINSNVQPIQVLVGQQGILSAANLNASDAAYPDPSQITYNIISYPTQGFIFDNGQLAHSFTQADVNAGRVLYQSAMQVGLASELVDSFSYVVADPSFRQSPITNVTLKIEPLPPPQQTNQPYVDVNVFPTVAEGGQIFVLGTNLPGGSTDLHVTDNNPNIPSNYVGSSKESIIVYTVVQGPSHGKLVWLTSNPTLWLPGQPSYYGQQVTQFTQNDLHNGWFAYENDFTSGAADHFSFTVSDGFGGTIGLTTATIPVQPVNPIVLRINAGMFVTPGGQSILSPDWLRLEDNAPNANLTLTLKQAPSHGTILLSGQPATTFTLNNLYQLSYRQNGSAVQTDQFTFSVTDAYGNQIPDLVIPVTIKADALDLNTGAIAGIGQSILIGGTNLHLQDPGLGSGNPYADTAPYLVYTLNNVPTHGALSIGGTALKVGDQFTQDQLDQNLLTYTEDGSIATSDSFGFSLSDAFVHNSFGSSSFNISIVNNSGGRNFQGGEPAANIFYSGPGNNWVEGGSDTILNYSLAPASVSIDLSHGTASNGFGGIDTLSNIRSIVGSPFDDMLIVGAGDDTIVGGGGADTVVFSGNHTDYAITYSATNNTFSVADQRPGSPNGVDTISGVQKFQFADGVSTYDTGGSLNTQKINKPNGNYWVNAYDTANATSWAWSTSAYDPNGNLTSQTGMNDDGTHWLTMYDVNNIYSFSNATITFDANWNWTSVTGTNDNGSHSVIAGTIAAAYDTLLWYETPYDPNSSSITPSVLTGGSGNDVLAGTAGNDTLIGGPGNDILYGQDHYGIGGSNTFVFGPGFGQDKIMDFQTGQDTLQFSLSLLSNFSAAMADAKQVGANTVITTDANDSVTLQNVNMNSLTASNFHFS